MLGPERAGGAAGVFQEPAAIHDGLAHERYKS
jgi:hypothetical protein